MNIFCVISFAFILLYTNNLFAQDKVSLHIASLLVSPAKSNGKKWDGFGDVQKENKDMIRKIVENISGDNLHAKIVQLAIEFGVEGTNLPDVYGYAEIVTSRNEIVPGRLSLLSPNEPFKDTITPKFKNNYIHGLSIKSKDRVRVTIYDKDLKDNDHIGTFEINSDHIMEALKKDKLHNVIILDQTNEQIISVQISVIKCNTENISIEGDIF